MTTQARFSKIIAVEPDHENATLASRNFLQNGITAEVIEAAMGPKDGTAYFHKASSSNVGRVGAVGGTPIRMISVESIVKDQQLTRIALAKIDIEGSEEALFHGPSDWLQLTESIVIEFHPTMVDYPSLTKLVASRGFDYIPPAERNTDCFVRSPKSKI